MKSSAYLNSIIEKNYGELVNQIYDLNLSTNNNYPTILNFYINFLNNEKKNLYLRILKLMKC